jgi:hypothetical protein
LGKGNFISIWWPKIRSSKVKSYVKVHGQEEFKTIHARILLLTTKYLIF